MKAKIHDELEEKFDFKLASLFVELSPRLLLFIFSPGIFNQEIDFF
jgi:hypothetical protein